MASLNNDGKYTVSADVAEKVKALFAAGCCDDAETKATIGKVFEDKNYLCDTHTAVAVKVYDDYVANTGDKTPTVIASTANPYKFSASVLAAITDEIKADNEFDMVDELFEKSNEPVPQQLATLKGKEPRFTRVSKKEDMKQFVFDMLGI
jgi:threonine synthase